MNNRNGLPCLAPVVVVLIALASPPAVASVFTDDLSKCLISKTTPAQKTILVNWMFSAMSLNPNVSKFASIPAQERKRFNVEMAHLFETLLTVSCRSETQLAVHNDGNQAIATGFNLLGQVAGRELFQNPEVAKGMSDLDKYIDMGKISAAIEPAK